MAMQNSMTYTAAEYAETSIILPFTNDLALLLSDQILNEIFSPLPKELLSIKYISS